MERNKVPCGITRMKVGWVTKGDVPRGALERFRKKAAPTTGVAATAGAETRRALQVSPVGTVAL